MYTLATRNQRFLAALVDGVILSMLSQGLFVVIGQPYTIQYRLQDSVTGELCYPVITYNPLSMAAGALISIAFMFYFYNKAQSPGKAIMKMQVVDRETGAPVSFSRMLLRDWVGKLLSGVGLGLGYISILWNKDNQGWHDRVAGTVVIKRS